MSLVSLANNMSLLGALLRKPLSVLNLSNGIVSEECEAWKLEVPSSNFITQGVSPRRDVV